MTANATRLVVYAGLVALGLAGCAHDVVLSAPSSDSYCGDGIRDPGEECDLKSPGCVGCVVVPTWTCSATSCTPQCGDGDGVVGCDEQARRDTDCDLTGWWAARETDFTRDTVVGAIQTSSTWFLYRFSQTGDDAVVEEELHCGVHVSGGASVDYTAGTLRGLLYANRMDRGGSHGPRHATSRAEGGGCAVSLDRWYAVRGASEDYLPPDFVAKPALASLPPLPSVDDPVTSNVSPPGSTDPDGDGVPGAAFDIRGLVSGVRESAQRDWKEYVTQPGAPVPAGGLSLLLPGVYDLQENVLRVTNCGGSCGLVASLGHVAKELTARVVLYFLGKTFGGPRVSKVVVDTPRANLDHDLTTCANVRLVLPHDASEQ